MFLVLQACTTRFAEFQGGGPAPAARHEGTHFAAAFGLGSFQSLKISMIGKWPPLDMILIDFKSSEIAS